MSYFMIGVILLIIGIYFLRRAIKEGDREGIVGMTGLIIASLILIIFFGLFYRTLALN